MSWARAAITVAAARVVRRNVVRIAICDYYIAICDYYIAICDYYIAICDYSQGIVFEAVDKQLGLKLKEQKHHTCGGSRQSRTQT
jgi:hypothetical protein